jgi:D-alanyl-D-alanine carboxypeptidase (penicillin-binding protein 5/6)
MFAKNENEKKEVASLTKIMTFFLCMSLIEKYSLSVEKTEIKVTKEASKVPGTSAFLKKGDLLSLHDLFHGLMLPSGNDAGYLLA